MVRIVRRLQATSADTVERMKTMFFRRTVGRTHIGSAVRDRLNEVLKAMAEAPAASPSEPEEIDAPAP